MNKQFFIFILFSALCIFGAWSSALPETHSGTMNIEVDLSSQAKRQSTRLWLPFPVSDRNQLISDLEFAGDYSAIGVYTERTYGTPILYAEWPKDATSRKLTFSFIKDISFSDAPKMAFFRKWILKSVPC
jgi:hypothetical protein